MIGIINYGIGNLGSVSNMLKHIGIKSIITQDINELKNVNKLILPGVGAFDAAMKKIMSLDGLMDTLNEMVKVRKVPILGICLGMQLLMQSSQEGTLPGFGWIEGKVIRFCESNYLKVPHMGWNVVKIVKSSPITEGMYDEEQRFYFVHSYYVLCEHTDNILGVTYYGNTFHSIIQKENIFGVQFHPEKSHRFGMKLLKNFSKL